MKKHLFDYLKMYEGSLSLQNVLINFLIALAIAMVIYLAYRFSHSGAVYSAKFNVSLVMLTLITTLVMNVIGNNIALSLGMVGALSIVRFRTAIKDPRDTVFIFWCIAVGICCGVSEYTIAALGSGIIFLFLILFGSIKSNDRFLLVIHGMRAGETEIESTILTSYEGRAILRVKNTTAENVEYIYELSEKMIEKAEKRNISITNLLYEVSGVEAVNLICQNEEISR
ncbi:DUF4956 domain-containing protein [Clostridium malenominatum]|uniref:DUF4956 domain-containing protein n=1 Tax=Clostridium malenominatum TaxID=1539 RepID=A0ABN1J1I3_9CLOT